MTKLLQRYAMGEGGTFVHLLSKIIYFSHGIVYQDSFYFDNSYDIFLLRLMKVKQYQFLKIRILPLCPIRRQNWDPLGQFSKTWIKLKPCNLEYNRHYI